MNGFLIGLLLVVVGFWAGVQNALAGGGSFVTFPALLLAGMDARAANITSTVALFPGQVATGIAGRSLVSGVGRLPFWVLAAISVAGGVLGAVLLLATPESVFSALVPWLVLFATAVFAWGSFVRTARAEPAKINVGVLGVIQLCAGIYGGYFGAGLSILMLSILGVLGMTDILEMSPLTSLFSLCINGVASILFIASKLVYWPYLAVMAVGAVIGGYGAAGIARKVGKKIVRRFVITVGFTIAITMFFRMAK
jgi:uncharacterized membrane protein YfcA